MTIEAEHICKAYGDHPVLRDFNLSIQTDACIVVTGPSGSGKTTFMRILLGLEKPDSGKIQLLGDYKYAYLCAGVVFQENRLCEQFSAIDNVAMVHHKITKQTARRELARLLPEQLLERPVRELSGGEQRRVAIVRACAAPADILVLDEPFTGLDADAREKALAYIMERKGSNPVLFLAHEIDHLEFCRKVSIV